MFQQGRNGDAEVLWLSTMGTALKNNGKITSRAEKFDLPFTIPEVIIRSVRLA